MSLPRWKNTGQLQLALPLLPNNVYKYLVPMLCIKNIKQRPSHLKFTFRRGMSKIIGLKTVNLAYIYLYTLSKLLIRHPYRQKNCWDSKNLQKKKMSMLG